MKNNLILYSAVFLLLLLQSCSPNYSPYLYDKTAELKTESLILLSRGTEPYAKYDSKVDRCRMDLESVVQQEKMRKYNKRKIKQWELMLAPEGYLLNGSFAKWQKDTILSEEFLNLQRKLIGEAFDLIQETEKQRLK